MRYVPAVDIVESLRRALDREPSIVLAVLFGSLAAGRARARSDVDLAIGWSADVTAGEREASLNRLERAAGRTVDAVDVAEAPPLLRMEIARTGEVLVERIPHAWSDFRMHAMIDWWDFAPLARRMHEAARARLLETTHGPR